MPVGVFLTYTLRESSFLGVGEGPTLSQFEAIFEDSTVLTIGLKTLLVGFSVALITTAVSFVFCYAVTFRMSRRRGLALLGLAVGAMVASYLVRVYAWLSILGANGVVNSALRWLGIIDEPLTFLVFGYFAVFLTMVYVYLPIAIVIMYGGLQNVDPRSLEASRDLGAGRWRTALGGVAPQVKTSLRLAFLSIAVLACSDYITPTLLGGLKGQMVGALVEERALFRGNLPQAAALAATFLLAILAATAVVAMLAKFVSRVASPGLSRAIRWTVPLRSRIPVWASPGSLSRPAAYLVCVFLTLPTVVVLILSFNSGSTLGLPFKGFTLDWYPDVTGRPGIGEAAGNSIKLAGLAALGGIALGLPVALYLSRVRAFKSRLLWVAVAMPYAVPGVLIGLALLIAATDRGVSLGFWLTLGVHVLLVAATVAVVLRARLEQLDPRLVPAARDLGATATRAFWTVIFPLLLPAVIGAALLGVAFSLDEILITQFTAGESPTLPVWILAEARQGLDGGINALGVLLLGGTLGIFLLAVVAIRWRVNASARGVPTNS